MIVPTLFLKDWMTSHYEKQVLDAIAAEHPGTVKVIFAVANTAPPERQMEASNG